MLAVAPTVKPPGLREQLAAPLLLQLSVTLLPELIVVAEAVKVGLAGGVAGDVTVTLTVLVADPDVFVQVSV